MFKYIYYLWRVDLKHQITKLQIFFILVFKSVMSNAYLFITYKLCLNNVLSTSSVSYL